LIGRAHDWLERSFLPGCEFDGPAGFNAQFAAWPAVANTRPKRVLGCNDYSVHPAMTGRRVEIITDLSRVRVVCDGKTVADHERVWAWHRTISDPEHVAAAKALRRKRIGMLRPTPNPRSNSGVSAAGEGLGGLLDATGIGAVAGVPLRHHRKVRNRDGLHPQRRPAREPCGRNLDRPGTRIPCE
jgi:hypothetical protein